MRGNDHIPELRATLACLTHPMAMVKRSWLKLVMMYFMPIPSSPIKFSAGTSTSSNSIYVVPALICPLTLSLLILTPLWPFSGTTMSDRPPAPGPPVLTAMQDNSLQIPFVIHFLVPLMIYVFPSLLLTAVVSILATSLPAPGSVMAMQALFFPVNRSGKNLFCNSLLPNLYNGGTPNAIPVVRLPLGPANPDLNISSV